MISVVVSFCTLDEDKELPVGNLSVLDFATSLSFFIFFFFFYWVFYCNFIKLSSHSNISYYYKFNYQENRITRKVIAPRAILLFVRVVAESYDTIQFTVSVKYYGAILLFKKLVILGISRCQVINKIEKVLAKWYENSHD